MESHVLDFAEAFNACGCKTSPTLPRNHDPSAGQMLLAGSPPGLESYEERWELNWSTFRRKEVIGCQPFAASRVPVCGGQHFAIFPSKLIRRPNAAIRSPAGHTQGFQITVKPPDKHCHCS